MTNSQQTEGLTAEQIADGWKPTNSRLSLSYDELPYPYQTMNFAGHVSPIFVSGDSEPYWPEVVAYRTFSPDRQSPPEQEAVAWRIPTITSCLGGVQQVWTFCEKGAVVQINGTVYRAEPLYTSPLPQSSLIKVLTEALEELLPLATIGEYLTESQVYSYGDGYSQPFEYGIDWQWQQSKPTETYGPWVLENEANQWVDEQVRNAKDDEVECVSSCAKARTALALAKEAK